MDLDPTNLLLFARVIDAGSFSGAAQRVGLPKSTVSRRISELERQLGERLLLRTTRKLNLTDFGHQLLQHARLVADEVDAAASLALHRQSAPSGRLRVSFPSDPPVSDLPKLVSDFLTRYPQVTLEIDLSARRVDLIGEGFDLALRMGNLPDDSTLVARRLSEHGWGLYASPHYLALRGTPREPGDLAQHDGLALRARSGEPVVWQLTRAVESGEPIQSWQGLPPLRAAVNSPNLLTELAAHGVGIAPVPDRDANELVRQKRLKRVLPGWCLPVGVGWAVTPGRRLMPEKTRVFIEMLEAELKQQVTATAAESKVLRKRRT